jgi:hypothetical protein
MNAKTKAIEILRKFANIELSININLHESIDGFLGDEDRNAVVACALILVEEIIANTSAEIWKEVRDEILNFSPSELKTIIN